MRRYFFDIREDGDLFPDEEGKNLSTLDAARDEVRFGNGTARDLAIEVRDDNGPVIVARFASEIKRLQ